VNPAGTRVYVANHGSNSISVLDIATNTVTATVGVSGSPYAFGHFIAAPPLAAQLAVPVASKSAIWLLSVLLALAGIYHMRFADRPG
jgi:YVTN family beta-propeller protein